MEIINPHDKFFKETFSIRENVIDFLSGTCSPEILKKKVFFEIGRKYFEEEGGVKFLESVIRYLHCASDISEE